MEVGEAPGWPLGRRQRAPIPAPQSGQATSRAGLRRYVDGHPGRLRCAAPVTIAIIGFLSGKTKAAGVPAATLAAQATLRWR